LIRLLLLLLLLLWFSVSIFSLSFSLIEGNEVEDLMGASGRIESEQRRPQIAFGGFSILSYFFKE